MSDPVRTWRLSPRDPLVFGGGARTPAFLPSFSVWLPPQATAAGLVRSTLAGGGTVVSKEDAAALLGVKIRGPWLSDARGEGGKPWVRIPADAVLVGEGREARLLRSSLEPPQVGEGLSGPRGDVPLPPLLTRVPSRDSDGGKTRRPDFPYRPLDWVLDWSLDDEKDIPWSASGVSGATGEDRERVEPLPVVRESRVHVGIEDEALTAEPEALFSSAGLRFLDGFELAVEVSDGRPNSPEEQPTGLLLLGGENRVSRVRVTEGPCFPPFAKWRASFEARVAVLEESCRKEGGTLGLRLQLLTPASFGGWRPAHWPAQLEDLSLAAVVIPGFEAVSGWDLQQRRPRAVRRLVPAGSVYTFGPLASGEALLAICEELWGSSLCAGLPGEPQRFLAPPENDGYGTVLPLPCGLPKEISSS